MVVGTTSVDTVEIVALIAKIKEKRELREINDAFVREQVEKYLTQHPKAVLVLKNTRSGDYKTIIKEVRSLLRRRYGLFRVDESATERRALLEEYAAAPPTRRKVFIEKILATHSSTAERLPFYDGLYTKIWKITGKPHEIIDLGCGLNPFSFPLMGVRNVTYLAYDISEEEIALIREFFALVHRQNPQCNGTAEVLDIAHWPAIERLPPVDVCFLFKVTDLLDQGRGHKMTEEVLQRLPCRFAVVSFATRTMSGKRMTAPRRRWVEWMCQRLGWTYKMIEIPNELFYVIEKGKT